MAEKKSAVEETPAVGFELEPEEIAVTIRFERSGRIYDLVHVFKRLMTKGERVMLAQEASRQRIDGDTIYLIGDLEHKYAEVWGNMIKAVEGYMMDGKSIGLEEARDRIPPLHKRRAVEATDMVSVKSPEEASAGEGFDFAAPDLVVELDAGQGGEDIVLRHIFSEPLQDDDLKQLRGQAVGIKTKGRELVADSARTLDLLEKVYDRRIESVEGYLVDGRPLTPAVDGWKERIPITHKAMVIRELRTRYEGLGRD